MTKREIIDAIQELNGPEEAEALGKYLEKYTKDELSTYLESLMELDLERTEKCKDETSSKIS